MTSPQNAPLVEDVDSYLIKYVWKQLTNLRSRTVVGPSDHVSVIKSIKNDRLLPNMVPAVDR